MPDHDLGYTTPVNSLPGSVQPLEEAMTSVVYTQ